MNPTLEAKIIQNTGASTVIKIEKVQSLWSDFGVLERVYLSGFKQDSIVIKRIKPPTELNHPRGWNSDVSAQRKLKSYEIERHWYEEYVNQLPPQIKTPNFLFYFESDDERVLGLEDLNVIGLSAKYSYRDQCFRHCLEWLANFHAFHINDTGNGLWEVGTYWHLDTRKDEWEAMQSGELKNAASQIDFYLKSCNYQTLVHGDAKPANFCFSPDLKKVAAVDFQYVGKGCGIKDVIYLMSSALIENELFRQDEIIINEYFIFLEKALQQFSKNDIDFDALKKEWMTCYTIAWSDFDRFLKGWNSSNRRVNDYMAFQTKEALRKLKNLN